MKFVRARDIVVASITIELLQNEVFFTKAMRIGTNHNFATRWFRTLVMSFSHPESLATFVSIDE